MTVLSYGLALLSCAVHAWWNYILKRQGGTQVFVGLTKISEALVFFLPFIICFVDSSTRLGDLYLPCLIGALFTGLNYISLAKAYSQGELSTIYPLSRAGVLIFLPIMDWIFNHERIRSSALLCILLIVSGTMMVQLRRFSRVSVLILAQSLCSKAVMPAIAAAFWAACYSLWDRQSVQRFPAFLYFYLYTSIVAAFYGIWILRCHASLAVNEVRKNWKAILQVGGGNTLSYTLVLLALRDANATYVISVRQFSMVIGAVCGWWLLEESMPIPKRVGLIALASGSTLMVFSR